VVNRRNFYLDFRSRSQFVSFWFRNGATYLKSDKKLSSAPAEIARVGGHYAVQGHSRSLILVPFDSPYATFY